MDEIPQWEIARYAVNAYSYLLPTSGVYSPDAMINYIKLAHEMDERTKAECDAIKKCVVKIVKCFETVTTTIRRS
jgi:hypothetical protein